MPAHVGLVRAMLRQQKIDEALDAVNTALAAQPSAAALLAAKGDVQFRLAQMSDAELSYLTAKKLDHKEVRCLSWAGAVVPILLPIPQSL